MTQPVIMEIPSEYKRLFDSDWREAAVFGGRYSLKSHTVARVLLIRARQKKIRVGCFREFQNSIAESSHQLLSDLIKQYKLDDFSVTDKTIINRVTGSDFIFKGLWNNEQSIKSIEGIDIAWVEEAQTITKNSIEVLTPTVRNEGSQIIYTYNRLTVSDPVHVRLVEEGRPNTLIINVNYDIAEKYGWLPDVIKDEIEDDRIHRLALYKQKWLGEPYLSPNDLLSESALVSNLMNRINPDIDTERVVIGVDTGSNIHYTMANRTGLFYYGYCPSVDEMPLDRRATYDPYDELEKRLRDYPKSIMVIDQGGDLIGARKLQARYRGRVFLIWTNRESKDLQLVKWAENDEDGKVSADRNRFIQQCVDEFNERRAPIWGSKEDWMPWMKHAMNIYRVKEMKGKDENDPQYGWRWEWKRKGADHWFMSYVYCRVGLDRFGGEPAQIIHKGSVLSGIPKAGNFTITTPMDVSKDFLGDYRIIDI